MTIGTLGASFQPGAAIGILLVAGVVFVIADQVARVIARHLRRERDRAEAEARRQDVEARLRLVRAKAGIFDDLEGRN